MIKFSFILGLIAALGSLTAGCATYHQDYTINLVSDPSGAEIWKGRYYVGTTPHLFHVTATSKEKKDGFIIFPELILKKEGYRPRPVELEVRVGPKFDWIHRVTLDEDSEAAR